MHPNNQENVNPLAIQKDSLQSFWQPKRTVFSQFGNVFSYLATGHGSWRSESDCCQSQPLWCCPHCQDRCHWVCPAGRAPYLSRRSVPGTLPPGRKSECGCCENLPRKYYLRGREKVFSIFEIILGFVILGNLR